MERAVGVDSTTGFTTSISSSWTNTVTAHTVKTDERRSLTPPLLGGGYLRTAQHLHGSSRFKGRDWEFNFNGGSLEQPLGLTARNLI